MERIYLDNNATTRLAAEAWEAMHPWLRDQYGNAASVHWFGQRAKSALEDARRKVATLIRATPNEIVFTGSGTEANNLAVWGSVEALRGRGRHVVTSSVEHPSVLSAFRQLEERGFKTTHLSVNGHGCVEVDEFRDTLRPDTVLVSVMLANNETGTLQPVQEMAAIARSRSILFHTDAVQAAGKIPVDVDGLGVDLLTISAHKIHGPQGIGALYVRKGVELASILVGGNQERKRRAGTENIPAAVGFGVAAEIALHDETAQSQRVAALRDLFEEIMISRCRNVRVNGHPLRRVPNTTNLGFEGVEGDALLMALDMEGVAASMGAACSSGSLEPSHVLKAMNVDDAVLRGSLRFSFSRFNTFDEVNCAANIVFRTVEKVRALSARGKN